FPPSSTAALYTLSLHDALPILLRTHDVVAGVDRLARLFFQVHPGDPHTAGLAVDLKLHCAVAAQGQVILGDLVRLGEVGVKIVLDRKSTRLNSSHVKISYAVFC